MSHENPYQTPSSIQSDRQTEEPEPIVCCSDSTRQRILAVAVWQRYMLIVSAVAITTVTITMLFSDSPNSGRLNYDGGGSFRFVMFIAPWLFVLHGFYKLTESLFFKSRSLLTFLLLTGVGLLLIPYANYQATQFLRSFGFDISWYGASPRQLDKLIRVTRS